MAVPIGPRAFRRVEQPAQHPDFQAIRMWPTSQLTGELQRQANTVKRAGAGDQVSWEELRLAGEMVEAVALALQERLSQPYL